MSLIRRDPTRKAERATGFYARMGDMPNRLLIKGFGGQGKQKTNLRFAHLLKGV